MADAADVAIPITVVSSRGLKKHSLGKYGEKIQLIIYNREKSGYFLKTSRLISSVTTYQHQLPINAGREIKSDPMATKML